jgi:hypothetical protein
MFFSCATRPMYVSSGRCGAIRAWARKAAPFPGRKRSAASPVGSTWMGVRGCDERLHRGALRAREVARREAPERSRQCRHVVVQVLFEEGVVSDHARHSRAARAAHSRVVRDEWRMDMHQVEILRRQRIECASQGAPAHAPVLGILGHRGGGNAQHVTLCDRRGGGGVARRDQPCLDALAVEVVTEGADGSRDAVDAREVDVGDEQDPHALASVTHGELRALG